MTRASVLEVLADGTRRRIVELLREEPRSVGELAELLPVTQPAVSQHLKALRESGVVRVEPVGRRRVHHLRREGLEPLRAWVESFWDGPLEAYRRSFDDDAGRSQAPDETARPSAGGTSGPGSSGRARERDTPPPKREGGR